MRASPPLVAEVRAHVIEDRVVLLHVKQTEVPLYVPKHVVFSEEADTSRIDIDQVLHAIRTMRTCM